jgi:hypothetical protein
LKNSKTAKQIGVTITPKLSARADKVINEDRQPPSNDVPRQIIRGSRRSFDRATESAGSEAIRLALRELGYVCANPTGSWVNLKALSRNGHARITRD